MRWFFSYAIMPTHILLCSQWHSSANLVRLFFCIWLICLIWHPVIFGYSHTSQISWVAIILQMIYRRDKQLQNFFMTVQRAFMLWELMVLKITTVQKMSQFWVIMLKNGLSHVVFVVSFSWRLVHITLDYR